MVLRPGSTASLYAAAAAPRCGLYLPVWSLSCCRRSCDELDMRAS